MASDPETLIRPCSDRGWKWLVRNLPLFLPSDPSNPESIKQISELALLYAQITQWLSPETGADIQEVGAFLLDFFSRSEIAQLARKRPSNYTAYIVPYLALRAAGKRIRGYEEALASLHSAGYPRACERIPYRAMELQHARWKAGLRQRPSWNEGYHDTALGLSRNPAYLVNWEVYSITHTLFYLTDFSGPAPEMPPDEAKRVVEIAEILLVHYWRKADWDLAGELLINLVALNKGGGPLFMLCVSALLAAWRADGALPGPTFITGSEPPSADYVFKHCYHTTLVGLLLCGGYLYRSGCAARNLRNVPA